MGDSNIPIGTLGEGHQSFDFGSLSFPGTAAEDGRLAAIETRLARIERKLDRLRREIEPDTLIVHVEPLEEALRVVRGGNSG